jgi:putative endonuclease
VRRLLGFGGLVTGRNAPARDATGGRREAGRIGERLAARHLRRSGYRVIARNVRALGGEADLVALAPDGRTLGVVEVKARRGSGAALPPEVAITPKKRRVLRRVAEGLGRRPEHAGRGVRIDVITVVLDGTRAIELRHHQGAV